MATNTLVTPEEYLLMAFDGPDREFVDGEVVEVHPTVTGRAGGHKIVGSVTPLDPKRGGGVSSGVGAITWS